jgi:hypothetical protein
MNIEEENEFLFLLFKLSYRFGFDQQERISLYCSNGGKLKDILSSIEGLK